MSSHEPDNPKHTILAFDPGTAIVGWAALEAIGDRLRLLGSGAITTPKSDAAEVRLLHIHSAVVELIKQYSPGVMALEQLFFAKNQTTALRVGQAVGVILLAAAQNGLPVAQYTPPQVKLAVVGEGNADKRQVQYMVVRLLGLAQTPKPDDVADAMAIAICHAHSRKLNRFSATG